MPLLPADYAPLIAANVLAALAAASPDALAQAEATARAELAAYLAPRYDVALALDGEATATPPVQPHVLLRRVWADLALYHLYTHAMPDALPAIRHTRYNDALAWLQAASTGVLNPQLPQRSTGEPPTLPPFYLYGSNPKINHR